MNQFTLLAILTMSSSAAGIAAAAEPSPTKLFNGKDLSGWEYFLVDNKAGMEDVWSVRDGILVCKGSPHGYLATKKKYKNFKLVVEWRWPGNPGNSGVLMRITGEPTMLPNCVEAQLASGSAGDMYGFQGFKIDGGPDRKLDLDIPNHNLGGHLRGLTKIAGNEHKSGEWNKYEITAEGEKITVVVNGKQLNEANCEVRAGQIGLQSEGGEIHFRTVELTPLDEA